MASNPRERLCLALDVPTLKEARTLVSELAEFIGIFKVGMELFTSEGPKSVAAIQKLGGKVFLDLKFHDIPNTVAGAARSAVRMGVAIFNVHASGGRDMMTAVAEAVSTEADRLGLTKPKVLAVTVLTSLSTEDLHRDLNIIKTTEEQVIALARLAKESGLDGVVASPQETEAIRRACGKGLIILTPGIRPAWAAAKGDQKRITTPADAIRAGSDYIVVGRPILSAENRIQASGRVLKEISDSLRS
jgi:orotidine-5'-phosphate decarboxylase